mgnify:CR=1 FL=1
MMGLFLDGKLMELVRTIVRPAITVLGFGTITYMVIAEAKIPEWYWTSVVGNTAWWFADRNSTTSPK